MKKRSFTILAAAAFAVVGTAQHAAAIGLFTSYQAPLVQPYARCGEELSTANCTSNLDFTSPWTFSAGAIEIDDSTISLRLDDMQLRSGESCPVSGDCRCWNSPYAADNCIDTTNCSAPNNHCGPNGNNSADNNWATIAVYLQNFAEGHPFQSPYVDHIRRDAPCYFTVSFDVTNTSTNKNRQINQTVAAYSTNCAYGSIQNAEIRHVEVLDKEGNVMAVTSF